MKFRDISSVMPDLLNRVLHKYCTTITEGRKSVFVFQPKIFLSNAQRSHYMAWNDFADVQMRKLPPTKTNLWGMVGLAGYISRHIM